MNRSEQTTEQAGNTLVTRVPKIMGEKSVGINREKPLQFRTKEIKRRRGGKRESLRLGKEGEPTV